MSLPIAYKGVSVDCAYRVDLVVDSCVVELKAIAAIEAVHEAQLLTYMRMGGFPLGLLINFNVPVLRRGIKRMVL